MVKRSLLSPSFFTLAYDLPWLKIKIRVRMLAASFCSFFWDLGGHEKAKKNIYAKTSVQRAIRYLIYSQSIKWSLSRRFLKTYFHFLVKLSQFLNNYLTGGTYRRVKIIFQERYPFRIPSIGKCYPFETHKRWGGGGGGAVSRKCFSAPRASVWSKNKWGRWGDPPLVSHLI